VGCVLFVCARVAEAKLNEISTAKSENAAVIEINLVAITLRARAPPHFIASRSKNLRGRRTPNRLFQARVARR
jgi:hypothetical protein